MGGAAGRWWWAATGIVLIVWALQISPGVSVVPWVGAVVVVLVASGLATLVASVSPIFLVGRTRHLVSTIAPWAIAAAVVGAFMIWSFLQVRTDPSYSTDEIAFDQYAATLALQGSNPYTHSMEPAFDRYHLSPNGATFRLNGTKVTSLSYPALSFEVYLPFLALGWSTQLAVALNVASWAVAMLLLFGLLPRHLRAFALVIGSFSTYVGYAVGGITDALYIPLLLGAAATWLWSVEARSPTGRRWRPWVSPVLFGLAMAVKQTPWLILPFVLLGIVSEVRSRTGSWGTRPALRYLAIAVGVFALPNLPYALTAPHQWLSGVLTPFINHTVPAGQGLIGLSLFLHIGGGSLVAYTAATVVALVFSLALYAAAYPLMRAWTFVLPSLVLFFAVRSFGSYLVMLAPVALLAAATHERGAPAVADVVTPAATTVRWRRWPVVALAGVLALGCVITYALTSSAPLTVAITGIRTTGQLATIERITVEVHNRSSASVVPSFTIESGGVITAFWRVLHHEAPLGPGRSASFTLISPNEEAQPAVSGGFAVAAFSGHPDAVSTSDVYLPSTWHIALVPGSVPGGVPLGRPETIRAEVLDRLNRPVQQGEIPVYLGQVIYDQHGLVASEATVNGSAPGHTPVEALTNSDGVAIFVIRGTQVVTNPVYFEANLVNFTQFYPYGYSNILLLRFGGSS